MKPINFPQSNKTLLKPESMTDAECSSLHVNESHAGLISCWKPTWRERLAILRGRPIWLWVIQHGTHPPVALEVENPFK